MKSKKILIIVITIILVLAVAGATFAYLFLTTDIFKSDKELFSNYMTQNVELFEKLMSSNSKSVLEDLKNEEKYESNTELSMSYSEGGEISNPINDLSAKIYVQKDNANNYLYADGQVLFGEEEYLESEVIKENELYGIRFSDVTPQFVTIKNDENFEAVAKDIGIDSFELESLMEMIDGTKTPSEEVISNEEITSLKQKYSNIIVNNISKGTFGSLKKAIITYNNNTIKTNAYSVELSSAQVENMLVEILNNLKTETTILGKLAEFMDKDQIIDNIDNTIEKLSDEEVPTIKITLYEYNKTTIRTVIEIGNIKATIESVEQNGEIEAKIQISQLSTDATTEYVIEILKNVTDNAEIYQAEVKIIEGEDTNTITFESQMQVSSNRVTQNIKISYIKDIITASLNLDNTINIASDFDKIQALDEKNNVVLNNLDEENRVRIISLLKEKVPEKAEKRIGLLSDALGIKTEETGEPEETPTTNEYEMTQVEVNRFNAKFEFYTGESVSAENVKTLLGIVKENLGSCEITQLEDHENTANVKPEDIKYNIKLNIEKDQVNEEAANQALEKINDKKKYNVSITYKEFNNLIDYITITLAD